ncbi:MAG: hypothetical protein PHS14_19480, partial [Elusimicrobia bacterium]|nr:hypothetical protein [Elusimicrobiota bacterium]
RPAARDMTGGMPVNEAMLRGLYRGDYRGLEFASPLVYTPIATPVNMMGLPTPTSNDDVTQAALNEITQKMAESIHRLNRAYLLLGTAWMWPRFDSSAYDLVWESIPDSVVSDILIDISSGRPGVLLTDEQIALSTGENKIINVQRKRRFEAARVRTQWLGQRPEGVDDNDAVNVAGVLPIDFAHDADEGEIRGVPALSRIIRDLKDYHDTDFRVSEILTKFLPKQIQTAADPGKWRGENGLATDADLYNYDLAGCDFILNRKDDETTFEHLPSEATSAHEKALERKYWKIIEGSGVPEIFWGISLSGNHADGDNQMQKGVQYVDSLRAETAPSYERLYASSLRLMSIARGVNYKPFTMGWKNLESISAEVKSKIFLGFAQAVSSLAGSATLRPEQLYTLWTLNYPESKPGTFEEFAAGMEAMAKHKQLLGLDYFSGLEDAQGKEPKKPAAKEGESEGDDE